MKKNVALLMTLLVVGLGACKKKETATQKPAETTVEGQATQPTENTAAETAPSDAATTGETTTETK